VEVVAIETETGVKTLTRINETGFYVLRQLPIGGYSVEAHVEGFRRHVRHGIELTTGQALQLNLAHEVGGASETVTVSARASLLETRNADAGQLSSRSPSRTCRSATAAP
jgi:hypothetical protein